MNKVSNNSYSFFLLISIDFISQFIQYIITLRKLQLFRIKSAFLHIISSTHFFKNKNVFKKSMKSMISEKYEFKTKK